MTIFLRLLADKDKESVLRAGCANWRSGQGDRRLFQVTPAELRTVPGAPFAYWTSTAVRQAFQEFPPFECGDRQARQGGVSGDDFRWLRLWYEADNLSVSDCAIVPIGKGGSFSPFYADLQLVARWEFKRNTFFSFCGLPHRPSLQPASFPFYFRPALTWPLRTNGLSFRALPRGCIFSHKGPAAFVANDEPRALLALCALANSKAFSLLVSVQLARTELAQSYEVGLIQQTPVPELDLDQQTALAARARTAWSLKRTLDTIEETSHAFALPAALRKRIGEFDPLAIESELVRVKAEIDAIAFDLYRFGDAERTELDASQFDSGDMRGEVIADEEGDEDSSTPIDHGNGLASWAVGVAFGRFDWRLATGERPAPAEPEPFDPLPAKSPGMLPDDATPFHDHAGMLVDDVGHAHDLVQVMEDALTLVDIAVPGDLRRWLQKDFFPFHLQRYSKSRRKAPIYWPLSTSSASFTLWVYYPSLDSQTLYTAVNDFIEPKLTQVVGDVAALRNKGVARTRDDEKRFEALQALEMELIGLRDSLLKLAPTYKPNRDDGVQVSAAPLWPLFRHTPWQRLLRETWAKLEKGEYDWAHLAMNYWPDRVREKCKTDKSLAIAHGLQSLYVAPVVAPKKTRGKKKGAEE